MALQNPVLYQYHPFSLSDLPICIILGYVHCRVLFSKSTWIVEGACPPMLRANVVARGPHLPLWQGLTPHVLLRDFFDADELPLRWSKTGSLSIFFYPQREYPLVNVYITMERSTIFSGKIHYKYL